MPMVSRTPGRRCARRARRDGYVSQQKSGCSEREVVHVQVVDIDALEALYTVTQPPLSSKGQDWTLRGHGDLQVAVVLCTGRDDLDLVRVVGVDQAYGVEALRIILDHQERL